MRKTACLRLVNLVCTSETISQFLPFTRIGTSLTDRQRENTTKIEWF